MNTTVVIIGANGFLGRYLCRHFASCGREVVAIARNRKGWSGDGMFLEWDGKNSGPWAYALEGAEAVINLTGRNMHCRASAANREEILRSRIDSTNAVGKAIAECRVPPALWLNASTAAIYRQAAEAGQDEWRGEAGEGFPAEVAQAWEEAFFAAKIPAETRKVALRIGMVLANEGGTAYDVFKSLTSRGLGGTMGPGCQRVSWIHMTDFLRAVEWVMRDSFMEGMVNLTAPEFPTNREMMGCFREAADMPLGLSATAWLLKLGAYCVGLNPELVTKSHWAVPLRLREAGFRWRYGKITEALEDLENRRHAPGRSLRVA